MRVAILHPTYWPEVERGAERIVHDLAAGLTHRGHDVTVLTTHLGRTTVGTEDGFAVVRARRAPGATLDRLGFEPYVATIPGTVRRLLGGRYDVAHAFSHVDGWAAVRARRLGGPPVVVSLMGIPDERSVGLRRLRRTLLAGATRGAVATSVLSAAAARELRLSVGVDPAIVPPGVYCERFRSPDPLAEAPTLVCTASLNDPRKRIGLLLRAFSLLRQRRPEARLVLARAIDPQQGRLPFELPDGAAYLDTSAPGVLAGAYTTAWASVLPSVDEAFGLVLVESLAAGTPVVAARSGAWAEIVTDGAIGTSFLPDDERDLTRALENALELAGRPGTRDACVKRARQFDWSRVLPRWEALYERVPGGSAGRLD